MFLGLRFDFALHRPHVGATQGTSRLRTTASHMSVEVACFLPNVVPRAAVRKSYIVVLSCHAGTLDRSTRGSHGVALLRL